MTGKTGVGVSRKRDRVVGRGQLGGSIQQGEQRRKPFDPNDYLASVRIRCPFWDEVVAHISGKQTTPPKCPYQVEIHARQEGCISCPCDCLDCCGGFLRTKRGMTPDMLCGLYEDLIGMGVPSVVLSGTHTDPACLDSDLLARLIRMGGPAWGIKLYSSGLIFPRDLQEAVVEASCCDPHSDSYVTLSRHTTDPAVFAKMCRPRGMSGTQALRVQEDNLRSFLALAEAQGMPLRISVNCRLTQINSDPALLAELLRWFLDRVPAPGQLRFTTDYIPTLATPAFRKWFRESIYVNAQDARAALDAAFGRVGLSEEDRKRVSFRAAPLDAKHDVALCLNRLLFAAVSPEGLVYPCQGMAGAGFEHLAYGDLRRARFPSTWARYMASWREQDPVQGGCPHCAAECERQVCIGMTKAVQECRGTA